MRNITKLTPALLQRIIKEEKRNLIKMGILKEDGSLKQKPKRKKQKKVSKVKALKELALIEKQQRKAVKVFKLLFERKQNIKKRLK